VPCHFQRSGASPHCPLYRRQSSSSPCLTLHYSETSSSASLKCDRLSCPRSIPLACPPHARMLIPFPRTPRHTLATSLWNSSLSSDRQHPMGRLCPRPHLPSHPHPPPQTYRLPSPRTIRGHLQLALLLTTILRQTKCISQEADDNGVGGGRGSAASRKAVLPG